MGQQVWLEKAVVISQHFQLRGTTTKVQFSLTSPTLPCLCSTFLLAISFTACQPAQQRSQRLAPLPQDPFVEVYFNHKQSAKYAEPYRKQTRAGDNLEQQIVEAIAVAQSTIDVAVQELRLPIVAQALAERRKAGVKVRVILENTYSRP